MQYVSGSVVIFTESLAHSLILEMSNFIHWLLANQNEEVKIKKVCNNGNIDDGALL